MAYRLHKRLVRTGREQPKETMNHKDRSSFFPVLFNLPNNHLDRQGSLTRRRQLINYENKTHLIPLSDIITDHDDVLPLIRERIHFLHQNKIHTNIRRDELAIKQRLLNTSLLEQGTIKDFDGLINDYYASLEEQEIKTVPRSKSNIVKLPMLKHSSHRIETIR
jgi:hypothetical protein